MGRLDADSSTDRDREARFELYGEAKRRVLSLTESLKLLAPDRNALQAMIHDVYLLMELIEDAAFAERYGPPQGAAPASYPWRAAADPPRSMTGGGAPIVAEGLSLPVLVRSPAGMYVAHYDADEGRWVLSLDNRYGFIFLSGVTHWRELPEGPK